MNGRVLVVDDQDAWQVLIESLLRKSRRWRIVGRATDGHDAVEKADALAPDVILLDIELPTINGIEAARLIRARNPHARILFVTAHRSWDVAAAALAIGACGYVVKAAAGRDLLLAMEAIVANERFISSVLVGAREGPDGRRLHRHELGVYADDGQVLDGYAHFAAAALEAGNTVIVLAEQYRRDDLYERLRAAGVGVAAAAEQRRYRSGDVSEILSPIMVDGLPDEARFWNAATAMVIDAARTSRGAQPGVAICGDASGFLLRQGKVDAAIRLEQLCDRFSRAYNVDAICGYSTAGGHDIDGDILHKLCRAHSTVVSR